MLSPKVKEALEEAQASLRNALFYAAKNEKPGINKQISDVMVAIECMMRFEEMSDKIESMLNNMKKDGDYNGLF